MPEAGTYSYLNRLLAGRRIPIHRSHLQLAAAIVTVAGVATIAVGLWLAPWPLDALAAVAAATTWTSWLDREEQA